MADTIVIFEPNGVRIKEGEDARDYRGRTDVAINPTFPRGVPPHEWKLKDGKILLPAVIEPPQLHWFKRFINFILRRK